MSSLAATQADGYYVPVEYFEGGAYKRQSKNQFYASNNSSTNKNSSKSKRKQDCGGGGGGGGGGGHNQWLQNGVVRFEMPHQGHCLGPECTQIAIGQGTRYNARKVKSGNYFASPIYDFHLKCRSCGHPWIIRTNPAERCFDFVSGIKKQGTTNSNEPTAAVSGNGVVARDVDDDDDPLERLESAVQGKDRAVQEWDILQQLKELNERVCFDDAAHNAEVRRAFRKDRIQKCKQIADGLKLGWRRGMQLLPSSSVPIEGIVSSKETIFGTSLDTERKRMSKVRQSSIFNKIKDVRSKKRRRHDRPGSNMDRPDHVPSSSSSSFTSTATSIQQSSTEATSGSAEIKSEQGRKRRRRKIKIVGENATTVDLDEKTESSKPSSAQKAKSNDHSQRSCLQKIGKSNAPGASTSSMNDLLAGYGTSDDNDE